MFTKNLLLLNFQQLTSVCLSRCIWIWLIRKMIRHEKRSWKSMFKFSALLCLLCLYSIHPSFFILKHEIAEENIMIIHEHIEVYYIHLLKCLLFYTFTTKILLIVVTFKNKCGELNENYAIKQSFFNHSHLNEACLSCAIPLAPRKKFLSCIFLFITSQSI